MLSADLFQEAIPDTPATSVPCSALEISRCIPVMMHMACEMTRSYAGLLPGSACVVKPCDATAGRDIMVVCMLVAPQV
jgi:hypothetical protein